MKTFLHFTKEKELDESILGAIGSGVGAAVKGVTGVAKALTGEKAKTIGGILGGKDGKLSTSLSAISDAEENKIIKRKKCRNLKTKEIPRAETQLLNAQAAGNAVDVAYWSNELQELDAELDELKC
jgi:hypothetical protein